MTDGLSFAVLGPVEVRIGGRPVDLPAGRQRALLAALLLADGAVVPVDRLVAALWPEGAVPSARNTVQSYVARLRRTLGPAGAAVRTRPPGYLLDAGAAARDDREFLDRVRAAEDRLPDAPQEALARLEEALALWRGPAWAEYADSFARGEALRLEERRHVAAERRVELLTRTGRPEAVAAAEALVADRPLAERPVVLLAEALGAAGRTPEALAALASYRERLREELGLDPGGAVTTVQARLLRGEVAPAPEPASAPQPAPGSPPAARPGRYRAGALIGRDRLLATLRELLAEASLVSLVGPGGVGKTRLAQHLAGSFAPRCWWADLAPLREPDLVARAVADTVGVAVPPGGTPHHALAAWAATADGLLVLDNCEHLLPSAAEVVETVLTAGGSPRVLATSRERLGVDGEVVQPVAPLPVPVDGDPGDPAATDAVKLFLDRARRADPQFAPTTGQLVVIGELCRRLDGLPLAIEFAAARVRGLAVEDLVARLDARLDLLTSDRRSDDERHRTLRGVIDWSYALLSPDEQAALRALGAFTGRFDLSAAEAVLEPPPGTAADLVARLVDRSVLHREPGPPARYRLLESVRAYVHERSGPGEVALARHTRWVRDLVAAAEPELNGPDEARWAARVTAAVADVRAAVARARSAGRPEVVAEVTARLWRFACWRLRPELLRWGAGLPVDRSAPDPGLAEVAVASAAWAYGDVTGARALAAEVVDDAAAHPVARGAAYEVLGDALMGAGRPDRAAETYARGVASWRAAGRATDAVICAANQALACGFAGDEAGAGQTLTDVLAQAAEIGNPSVTAFARYVEGEVLADLAPDRALTALADARRLAGSVGNDLVTGLSLTASVALRGRHGPPDAALALYAEALAHWHRTGPQPLLVTALRNLVVLLARTGRDQAAAELAATLELHAADHPSYGPERRRFEAARAAVAARLDPHTAARAAEVGRRRSVRQASAAALAVVTAG